ncbi:MAG: YHS domain-containing protein [Nitrospira sp.]|nr:YHS domain-containing protein [Nitrospira sp.]
MYRFLLISALLVILYFLLRQAVRGFRNNAVGDRGTSLDQDQMVEDPVCHTFVPRRNAVTETVSGQTYCFCSKRCADAFKNRQSS